MPSVPRLRLQTARLLLRDCRTRQPFRFGVHTLTVAPLVVLEATVEVLGHGVITGRSSDLLVPKWFEKDRNKSPREDVLALLESARGAITVAKEFEPVSAFEAIWRVYDSRSAAGGAPPLLLGFGVALLERALLDALCRALRIRFHDLLRSELTGFDPARLDPATAGWVVADRLPQQPSTSIVLRHTVGLLDPLETDPDGVPPQDDGEPHTLAEAAKRDRLSHFKVKFSGDAEHDHERLLAIASVLDRTALPQWRFTLDGNEQYASLASLADLLDDIARTRRGREIMARLLYTEQPLPRGVSFDTGATTGIERFDRFGGLIIDEADGEPSAFPRALAAGYRGVSMKNCKGVFRALTHRARIDLEGRGLQSGEDLTNLPILALQQDLATAATLHLPSVERNGHHYFRGLDHLDPEVQRSALDSHPDLYEARDGGVFLRIENGRLGLGSTIASGYGSPIENVAHGFVPADEWSPPADLSS